MKTATLLSALILFSFIMEITAQPVLTLSCNKPRTGDCLVKQQTEYIKPGPKGENVLWDFNNLNVVNDHYELKYYSFDDSLMIGQERQTLYKYLLKGDTLLSPGFENRSTLLDNLRPELLLIYPVNYQDKREDYFHGNGDYCGHLFLTVRGKTLTEADAYGRIVLPGGDTLQNVLRVHRTRKIVQRMVPYTLRQASDTVYNSDSIDYHLTTDTVRLQTDTYHWYADGYRYPVFEVIENQAFVHGQSLPGICTAFYYTPNDQYYDLNNDPDNQAKRDALQQAHIGVSPQTNTSSGPSGSAETPINYEIFNNSKNGFIRIDYCLAKECDFRLLLTDIIGRIVYQLPQKKLSAGEYSETIDVSSLQPGEYVLHILVDDQKKEEKIINH